MFEICPLGHFLFSNEFYSILHCSDLKNLCVKFFFPFMLQLTSFSASAKQPLKEAPEESKIYKIYSKSANKLRKETVKCQKICCMNTSPKT